MQPAEECLLVTGFTGFLGEHLVAELLKRRPAATLLALVRPASLSQAYRRAASLGAAAKRLHLLPGDIVLPDLGLESPTAIAARLTEIFHLAALYDLACPAALAEQVNVRGTAHLLAFASRCPHLRRFHYTSTCYVAGNHRGLFREEDLEVGQEFFNHYDRTKFAAEQRVRQHLSSLPITIYRPAIVVGHSQTGATGKFDGLYLAMNALARLPRRFVFPRIGSGRQPVNLVPVDFVSQAMAYLSGREESRGQCYHLADPSPLSALELQRALMELLDRRFLLLPVPLRLARWLLQPGMAQRYLGLPVQALPYFDYPAHFATSRTTAHLAGSGIACPRLLDYLPTLVRFWKQSRGD